MAPVLSARDARPVGTFEQWMDARGEPSERRDHPAGWPIRVAMADSEARKPREHRVQAAAIQAGWIDDFEDDDDDMERS